MTSQAQVSTLRVFPENTKDADASSFRSGVGDSMVFIDNSRIVSTGMGGLISVWNAQSGSRLALVDSLPEREFASTIDYSEATNRLVIGTSDGQILLTEFNGDDPGPLLSVGHLDGYIQDLQYGQAIVTTTNGPSHNVMAVIDRNRDKVVEKWTADLFVCDMEFSSDGKRLLTATSSGVFIYDTFTWKKEQLGADK